jgi:hypothetical protein
MMMKAVLVVLATLLCLLYQPNTYADEWREIGQAKTGEHWYWLKPSNTFVDTNLLARVWVKVMSKEKNVDHTLVDYQVECSNAKRVGTIAWFEYNKAGKMLRSWEDNLPWLDMKRVLPNTMTDLVLQHVCGYYATVADAMNSGAIVTEQLHPTQTMQTTEMYQKKLSENPHFTGVPDPKYYTPPQVKHYK